MRRGAHTGQMMRGILVRTVGVNDLYRDFICQIAGFVVELIRLPGVFIAMGGAITDNIATS